MTTAKLMWAITDMRSTRDSIVPLYALGIKVGAGDQSPVNWTEVNHAIIARWSKSALEYIKKNAWKLHDNNQVFSSEGK